MSQQALSTEQNRAVLATEGAVLVVAGAGAGKTKTLTHRIWNLIKQGIDPDRILAITFTNKASAEMRERVESLLSTSHVPEGRPFIGTFHSLGVKMLREWGAEIGVPKNFSIYDRDDAEKTIKEAIRRLGVDPKEHSPSLVLTVISRAKGEGDEPENITNPIFSNIWRIYEEILNSEKALDFDDLLGKSLKLLDKSKLARDYYQNKWHFVHIDEYQDTNKTQYRMARMLAEPQNNICVVGDADQTIYTWRGATVENILKFEKDYPDSTTILLEENYRSTKNILNAANGVIEKNKKRHKKTLFTANEKGAPVTIFTALDQMGEAVFVAQKTAEILRQGVDPQDTAVLYRANFQSRALEEAFINYGLPYHILGTRFYERKEVKETLSYLRFAQNQESMSDLKRIVNVPARGIGKVGFLKILSKQENELPAKQLFAYNNFKKAIAQITNLISNNVPPAELVIETMRISGIEEMYKNEGPEGTERLENIKELASLASRYQTLEEFLTNTSLASDQDSMMEKENKEKSGVRLMTVHASKGLEFQYVFVVGLEEGLFPHERMEKGTDEEEERRLFYVAITRAKKKLFLTHAAIRTIFGSTNVSVPSSFLEDIQQNPEVELETISYADSWKTNSGSRGGTASSKREFLIDF